MTSIQSIAFPSRACGIALVAAPLTLLVADLLRQAGQVAVGEMVAKVAVALFVPAVFGLVRLTRPRAALTSLFGMTLCIVGLLNVATVSTVASARWSLLHAGLAPAAQETVQRVLTDVLQIGALFPLPAPAFAAGLVVLSIALYRTGTASGLLALVVLTGGVLFPIGRIGEIPAAVLVSDLLLIGGLAPMALKSLRWTPEDNGLLVD